MREIDYLRTTVPTEVSSATRMSLMVEYLIKSRKDPLALQKFIATITSIDNADLINLANILYELYDATTIIIKTQNAARIRNAEVLASLAKKE